MFDPMGVWTGRVRIQFDSELSLMTFVSAVHGTGLEANGMCFAVEVESQYISLEPGLLSNHSAARLATPVPTQTPGPAPGDDI